MLRNFAYWSLVVSIIATCVVASPIVANTEVKRGNCDITDSIKGIISDLKSDFGKVVPMIKDIGDDLYKVASTFSSDSGCATALVTCISTIAEGYTTCGSLAACSSLLGNTGFISTITDSVSKSTEVVGDALNLIGEIPLSCLSDSAITAIWPVLESTLGHVSNFGKGVIHIINAAEKAEISLANTGFKVFVDHSTEILEDTIDIAKPIVSHAPFFNTTLVNSLNDLEFVFDSLKNVTTSVL